SSSRSISTAARRPVRPQKARQPSSSPHCTTVSTVSPPPADHGPGQRIKTKSALGIVAGPSPQTPLPASVGAQRCCAQGLALLSPYTTYPRYFAILHESRSCPWRERVGGRGMRADSAIGNLDLFTPAHSPEQAPSCHTAPNLA